MKTSCVEVLWSKSTLLNNVVSIIGYFAHCLLLTLAQFGYSCTWIMQFVYSRCATVFIASSNLSEQLQTSFIKTVLLLNLIHIISSTHCECLSVNAFWHLLHHLSFLFYVVVDKLLPCALWDHICLDYHKKWKPSPIC